MPEAAHSRHVLIFGVAANLVRFRGPLIKAMLAAGHRVTAVADEAAPGMAATVRSWGADFRVVPLARGGMNPFADVASLRALVRLTREVRPDIFFGYTFKPSIYGMLAARLCGVRRRVAMITGLGYAFMEGTETRRRLARFVLESLCRWTLGFADRVIFQNPDDQARFIGRNLVAADRAVRVEGSGVDLACFSPVPLPKGPLTFLLAGRLIRDKGIREFIEAARRVKRLHPETRFVMVGGIDPNPTSLKRVELEALIDEGTIEWPGEVADVRPFIASSHVVVLPSYGEGLPRSLVEAMAMGRAVITTDVPGCRETVEAGRNGILVPPHDAEALALAMLRFVTLPQEAARMGGEGRPIAERRFDIDTVNARMLEIILAEPKGSTSGNAPAAPPEAALFSTNLK